MGRYKIISEAKVKTYQYIDADSEDEAMKIWENSDTSLENIDENTLEDFSFDKIIQVR